MDDADDASESDREILRRGLTLNEAYNQAAVDQDAAREAFEKAERELGQEPGFMLTDEERAWDEHRDRQTSFIAFHKKDVLEQFNLKPENSVLYKDFPQMLNHACNPGSVIVYDPALREFGLMETWGPATYTAKFCPFSGNKLPAPLRDEWFDLINELMGSDDWSMDQAREQLSRKYFNEEWWIKRGL